MPLEIIPNIDYKFWLNAGRNAEETSRVAAMMTTLHDNMDNLGIKEGDPLWDILNSPDRSEKTMKDVLELAKNYARKLYKIDRDHPEYHLSGGPKRTVIQKHIREEENIETSDKDNAYYLSIFSAIQAWGGKQGGENPIIAPGFLSDFNNWLPKYKKAIKTLEDAGSDEDSQEKAIIKSLDEFVSITNIAKSFGTKHLWFWTEFLYEEGVLDNVAGVSDKKTDWLLFGEDTDTGSKQDNDYNPNYGRTASVFNKIRKQFNLDNFKNRDVEKALFNFSKNYFSKSDIGSGGLKQNPSFNKNQDEAQKIYNARHAEYNGEEATMETPEQTATRKEKEKKEKEALDKKNADEKAVKDAQYAKDKKEKALYDKANAEVQSNTRKFERQAYEEIVPQNIRDILGARVTASDNRRKKARAEKDALQGRQLEREKELKDEKIKELISQYRKEEEQINETWNKWAKWATKK